MRATPTAFAFEFEAEEITDLATLLRAVFDRDSSALVSDEVRQTARGLLDLIPLQFQKKES